MDDIMSSKQLGGIITFLILTIAIYEIGGGKPTVYFLLLVILGIFIVNTKNLKIF